MRPVNILIVDDEHIIHEMIQEKVEDKGYNIISAYTVQEAINIVKAQPINLIVADVYLPGQTGISFIEVFKADKKMVQIPKIIMTARPDPMIKREAAILGAVDIIEKSADLEKLTTRIVENISEHMATVPDPSADAGNLAILRTRIISEISAYYENKDQKLTADAVVNAFLENLQLDHISFWVKEDREDSSKFIRLAYAGKAGLTFPRKEINPQMSEIITQMLEYKEGILINNAFRSAMTIDHQWAKSAGVVSEVILPFYRVSSSVFTSLIEDFKNKEVLGLIIIHSNALITENQFKNMEYITHQISGILTWIYSEYDLHH